eukprot:523619-Amphidinium_carterae.1
MTLQSCGRKQMQRRSPREQCRTTWSQKGQREEREGGPGRSFSRGPPKREKLLLQRLQIRWWLTMTRRRTPG